MSGFLEGGRGFVDGIGGAEGGESEEGGGCL